jgi:hypothetical protein
MSACCAKNRCRSSRRSSSAIASASEIACRFLFRSGRHGGAAAATELRFLRFHAPQPGTRELAAPSVYSILDFTQANDTLIRWEGSFTIERGGRLSALRFITKNVLAIVVQRSSTIDWLNHYMVLPIAEPIDVCTGDKIRISFQYRTGGSIPLLQNAIQVQLDSEHQAMSFERRALMVA